MSEICFNILNEWMWKKVLEIIKINILLEFEWDVY